MGYCYSSTGLLCCDCCGKAGGVRKRTCTAKVLTSTHKTVGKVRVRLPYCSPPALCDECYKKNGGSKIHAKCRILAAEAQQAYDEEQRRLDAGELRISGRWGSWHKDVPDGQIGCLYEGTERNVFCLVESGTSDAEAKWLSAVRNPLPWNGPQKHLNARSC